MTEEPKAELDRTAVPVDSMPITWKTLNLIARTEMVPAAFRGRPEAMMSAMLAGRELGLPPMESLRAIDVIDGRPSLSGELMLRLIREEGHKVRITEMTAKKATVLGIRADDPDEQLEVSFTIEDAERAGLAGKSNWKKYPQMMLTWRAITMLARFLFPDVIGAVKMTYTPDELGDASWVPSDDEADAVIEAVVVSETPVVDSEDDMIEDAEIVEDDEPVTPAESLAQPLEEPPLTATLLSVEGEQWGKLNALLALPDPTTGKNDEIEKRTRKLYMLMRAVDLWPDQDGTDQLHLDLMTNYGASHYGDLGVKKNMQAFAEWAWGMARETVEAHREMTEDTSPFEGME